MAKVIEQMLVIKFSKLAKDNAKDTDLINNELVAQLTTIAEELAPDLVVEVIKD